MLAFLLAAWGCSVFDQSLYLREVPDAGLDTAPPPPSVLADTCDQTVPTVESSRTAFTVDTSSLAGNVNEVGACTNSSPRGNDGFVAINAKGGERWHVHVQPMSPPELNPAIYVLGSCDARSCQPGMGSDACGPGASEHLSFIVKSTGRYFIGVDSREPGGGVSSVLVIHPICGNGGSPEHAETCDDGNTVSGDGCDFQCRKELATGESETEPNDDPESANMLILPPAAKTLARGRLGNNCDYDMYAVKVPKDGTITAKVLTPAGAPCPATAGSIRLSLMGQDGLVELKGGTNAVGEGCPSVTASLSTEGIYYLRTWAANTTNFDYLLDVEVTP